MALSRLKTWSAGEVLTAADLNAEFNNIINNALTLISPLTGTLDADGNEIILDSDADSSITASTDDQIDFKLGGTDIFRFLTVASAVNGIDFYGSATGNQPYVQAVGTDSNFGLDIRDSNGNEILIMDGVASAVNEVSIINAATGNNPMLQSSGEANTGLILADSNSNEIAILESVASAVNEVTITNAATTVNPTLQSSGEANTGLILADSNGNEITILESTASSVNEITITNAATGNAPDISATGGDTNIDISLTPKGTGRVVIPFAGALVYNSADETIATNTYTHLSFDSESHDTNSIHDTVTNNQRLTVPTGVTKIRLSANVVFASNSTGVRQLFISKNDETTTPTGVVGLPSSSTNAVSGAATELNVTSSPITVTGGDYFTCCVRQTSGGNLDVVALIGYQASFSMEILE